MSNQTDHATYLMLAIGHVFPGIFANDTAGMPYFETGTGVPPFRQENALAKALASGIQKKLLLNHPVEIKSRDAAANPREAQRILTLGGPRLSDEQLVVVRNVAITIAEQVCPGSQLSLLEGTHPSATDPAYADVAAECSHAFLRTNGGRRVPHPIQVVANGHPVTKIGGMWRSAPQAQSRKSIETETVLYNGRQLREHVLFVTKIDSRGTTLSIHYDEQRFDEFLRSLGENKLAALEIKYEAEYQEGKTKPDCTLLEAIEVDLPGKFQLS